MIPAPSVDLRFSASGSWDIIHPPFSCNGLRDGLGAEVNNTLEPRDGCSDVLFLKPKGHLLSWAEKGTDKSKVFAGLAVFTTVSRYNEPGSMACCCLLVTGLSALFFASVFGIVPYKHSPTVAAIAHKKYGYFFIVFLQP